MDNKAKILLEECGWYEGRQIEIDYLIQDIKNNDLALPNVVIENFLKEFGNLEIAVPTQNQIISIRTILDEIVPYIEGDQLKMLSVLANENIVPIAVLNEGAAYLFLSYSGKFFMLYETKFYFLGDNFFDVIDGIAKQKELLLLH